VRPPIEQEFLAQLNLAVADIPDDIRDQIKSVYASHKETALRDHQLDWVFYEQWRWGEGWLTNERHGCPLGVFHDPLAQRVRAAVVERIIAT